MRLRTRKRTPIKRGVLKNKLEIEVSKFLKSKCKFKVSYESDDIPYSYTVTRNYRPDFTIHLPDGTKRFIEVKGYLRPEDRVKMIAAKRCNPTLDIRIMFLKDNKVTGRKMRYSDWAKKYGFPYSIGSVPKEWLVV